MPRLLGFYEYRFVAEVEETDQVIMDPQTILNVKAVLEAGLKSDPDRAQHYIDRLPTAQRQFCVKRKVF